MQSCQDVSTTFIALGYFLHLFASLGITGPSGHHGHHYLVLTCDGLRISPKGFAVVTVVTWEVEDWLQDKRWSFAIRCQLQSTCLSLARLLELWKAPKSLFLQLEVAWSAWCSRLVIKCHQVSGQLHNFFALRSICYQLKEQYSHVQEQQTQMVQSWCLLRSPVMSSEHKDHKSMNLKHRRYPEIWWTALKRIGWLACLFWDISFFDRLRKIGVLHKQMLTAACPEKFV